MKNLTKALLLGGILVAASCAKTEKDVFKSLNAKASEEYLTTIRCSETEGPFWNRFAPKFIYAPAFDFERVDGAASYRFTLDYIDSLWRNPIYYRWGEDVPSTEETLASFEPALKSWSFNADSPKASLAPIWNEVTPGYVQLKVEAMDKDGNAIKTVGARKFLRDFPFEGPYLPAARPYREAAVMALLYNHFIPAIQKWADGPVPDFSYKHNGYPAKIVSATIASEILLAKLLPDYEEICTRMARNAADWLISISEPKGRPMEFCPPTYYADYIASGFAANKGTTMMMEPPRAARAFLDLYDLCGDKKYYDAALGIANVYKRLQRDNGSFPIKVYVETAEPVNQGTCTPVHILNLWSRMASQYGMEEFKPYIDKAEAYMMEKAIPAFDLTGQFEDVYVKNLHPFQNLNNGTYSEYAAYMLSKPDVSEAEIKAATEMIRLAEDQFVHWNALPCKEGFRQIVTPCVFEQYQYQTPVNASASCVSNGLMALYKVTGDKLALEKARALMDSVMQMQNQANGQLHTTWTWRDPSDHFYGGVSGYWVNCTLASVASWLDLEEILKERK